MTPFAGSSVSVIRAPVDLAISRAVLTRSSCGQSAFGAHSRTSMPELRPADQQGVAHVVAGVAHVAVRDLGSRLVAELGHRQDVGQDLGRVELVGQAVPDRDAGVPSEILDDLLGEAAVLDPVVDPAQDARRVLHRFLVPDLRAARAEVRDMGALVVCGDLERDPGARRGLLEDHRDVLAQQALPLVAAVLGGLQLGGQRQQELDLARAEIKELGEASVPQVIGHLDLQGLSVLTGATANRADTIAARRHPAPIRASPTPGGACDRDSGGALPQRCQPVRQTLPRNDGQKQMSGTRRVNVLQISVRPVGRPRPTRGWDVLFRAVDGRLVSGA